MSWQPMTVRDICDVHHLGDQVHPPELHEDSFVISSRYVLFRDGCRVLRLQGKVLGYAIAHPYTNGNIVALNDTRVVLPAEPNTLYIHDVVVHPVVQGHGYATRVVNELEALAKSLGYASMSLVAVQDAAEFWQRQGFSETTCSHQSLCSYGGKNWYLQKRLVQQAGTQ